MTLKEYLEDYADSGYTSQGNPIDKKRIGTHSQPENKRNSNL